MSKEIDKISTFEKLVLIALFLKLSSDELLKNIEPNNFPRCHESSRIWCQAFRLLGYNARVVDGFFDTSHRWTMEGVPRLLGSVLHSWIEFENYIIETDPRQMFPEEENTLERLIVIPKESRKACYYQEANTRENIVLFKRAIIEHGSINRNLVIKLTNLMKDFITKNKKRRCGDVFS